MTNKIKETSTASKKQPYLMTRLCARDLTTRYAHKHFFVTHTVVTWRCLTMQNLVRYVGMCSRKDAQHVDPQDQPVKIPTNQPCTYQTPRCALQQKTAPRGAWGGGRKERGGRGGNNQVDAASSQRSHRAHVKQVNRRRHQPKKEKKRCWILARP